MNHLSCAGLTAIHGAMVLIIVLLVVQIWLLSATLESYLAGHRDAALPGAIISVVLFAACFLPLPICRPDRFGRTEGVSAGCSVRPYCKPCAFLHTVNRFSLDPAGQVRQNRLHDDLLCES